MIGTASAVVQLVIVARDQPEIYGHLMGRFAGHPRVHVLFDRRHGPAAGRRHVERRRGPSPLDDDLARIGVIIVPRRLAGPAGESLRLQEEVARLRQENASLRRRLDALVAGLAHFSEDVSRPLDELRRRLAPSPPPAD